MAPERTAGIAVQFDAVEPNWQEGGPWPGGGEFGRDGGRQHLQGRVEQRRLNLVTLDLSGDLLWRAHLAERLAVASPYACDALEASTIIQTALVQQQIEFRSRDLARAASADCVELRPGR